MSATTDPRIMARRRVIAESNARQSLRRMFWILVGVALVGAAGWVAHSPWFSLSQLAVSGVNMSDAGSILAGEGVVSGAPLVRIRAGRVEERLLEDPWVASAEVRLLFPDRVEVIVVEREPVAWMKTGSRWAAVAVDGTVLRFDTDPLMPVVTLENERLGIGDEVSDPMVLGGIAFLAELPEELAVTAAVTERNQEIWAEVNGHPVRLGDPSEMRQKADTLVELLGEEMAPSTPINLVSPRRPAIGG